MGERLLVTLKSNDRKLAAVYYHWSAYTVAGLSVIESIAQYLEEHEHEIPTEPQQQVAFAVRALEYKTAAGFSEVEVPHIGDLPASVRRLTKDHGDGFIHLQARDIEELAAISDASIEIDIAEDYVDVTDLFISTGEEVANEDDWLQPPTSIAEVPIKGNDRYGLGHLIDFVYGLDADESFYDSQLQETFMRKQ